MIGLTRAVAVALAFTLAAVSSVCAQTPRQSNIDVLYMLMHNQYDALDTYLGDLQRKFEADPGDDKALREAFRAIERPPARTARDMDGALDAWVTRFPTSYVALTARGRFFVYRGLTARGGKVAGETSAQQFDEMQRYFALAREDLKRSLALTRMPLLSHMGLYAMTMRSKADGDGESYYSAAIAYAPRSEGLRELRMDSLRPRWHGSLERMEDYARETASAIGPGPTTNRMYNIIVEEHAWEYERRDDWAGAIAVYSEALAKRESRRLVCGRAWAHAHLNHWQQATADLTLASKPSDRHDYCAEAVAAVAQARIDDPAIPALLDAYIESNPNDGGLRQARGWLRSRSGRHTAAYEDLLLAAEAGQAWSQLMVGQYLLEGTGGVARDPAQALSWFRAAAAQGQDGAREWLIVALRDSGNSSEAQAERKAMQALRRERPFNQQAVLDTAKARPMGSFTDDHRVQAIVLGAALMALFVVHTRARARAEA